MTYWGYDFVSYYHYEMVEALQDSYLPEELSCCICGSDIESAKMYLVINDLNAYAHLSCVHDKVASLDKTNPIRGKE